MFLSTSPAWQRQHVLLKSPACKRQHILVIVNSLSLLTYSCQRQRLGNIKMFLSRQRQRQRLVNVKLFLSKSTACQRQTSFIDVNGL